MPAFTSIAIGAAAAASGAGAIAGAIPKTTTSKVDAGGATDREAAGLATQDQALKELTGLTAAGPGENDVAAGVQSSRDLAGMLDQYSKSGGLPGQDDVNAASGFASKIFDPQRTALSQSFTQQNTEAERLAARLGRPVNDPIIQAKLRTGYMNQEAMLNSQQGAFGGQLALQLPGQRVQYASQKADVLGQLATQAFQNRSALMALGSGVAGAERSFRLNTATRTSSTGGGVGGAIEGGLAGLGTGLGFAAGFKGLTAPKVDPFGSFSSYSAMQRQMASVPDMNPLGVYAKSNAETFGVGQGPGPSVFDYWSGGNSGGRSYSLGGR